MPVGFDASFYDEHLASTAWVFAALGQSDEQLFTASVRAAEQRVKEFYEQDPMLHGCLQRSASLMRCSL